MVVEENGRMPRCKTGMMVMMTTCRMICIVNGNVSACLRCIVASETMALFFIIINGACSVDYGKIGMKL